MYSMSLLGQQKITSHSAALIDNIFTNVIDTKVTSGLIINDASDHLPLFAIVQGCIRINRD